MSLLDIRNLSIYSRDNPDDRLVDRISLTLNEGEIVALVGESGSGKSLVAQAITGQLNDDWQLSAERIAFDDIDLLINFSRIHDFLKDIGIRQEILPEGLFKGKTVTLQHCLGHAIICNSHFFSFLISLGVKGPLYFRLNNWPSPLRLVPNKSQTTPGV